MPCPCRLVDSVVIERMRCYRRIRCESCWCSWWERDAEGGCCD